MKLLRTLLHTARVLVALYFLFGSYLLAYHDVVIYPDRFAGIFETVARHIHAMNDGASEFFNGVIDAASDALESGAEIS